MAGDFVRREPKILQYRVDPTDNIAAFAIGRNTSGGDVALTLAYLTPDATAVIDHLNNIVRYAIDSRNAAAGMSLPLPQSGRDLSVQSQLVTHIDFGPHPRYDDVEYALQTQFGFDKTRYLMARLAMGYVSGGLLLGHVVEVQHNNEFVTSSDAIAREMAELTDLYGQ